MSRSVGIIFAIVLGVMVAGAVFLSLAGLAVYNYVVRGGPGSGSMATEVRDVSSFDKVSVCCGMHLLLDQGEPANLQLEGDENVLSRIRTYVKGDTLIVDYQPGLWIFRPDRRVRVYVTAPEVRGVDTSGGSSLSASDLATDRFDLSTSGGGSVDIASLEADTASLSMSGGGRAKIESLNVDTLDLSLAGGSQVEVASGETEDQIADLSGGSGYSAPDLKSQTAELNVAGGSNATIWVVESLDVNASGGSKVQIYGAPRITQDTSGGSRIQSLGER